MAKTKDSGNGKGKKTKKDGPPPWWVLSLVYGALGWVVLHFFGRAFGGVEDVVREFALPLLAAAVFVLSYEVVDTIGVARAALGNVENFKDGSLKQRFHTAAPDLPRDYVRAVRAQANQVEQVPFFIVVLFGAVLFADGFAIGSLGALYVAARVLYGCAYRAGRNIGLYTIPCYFIMGALSAVNIIGATKLLVAQ